MPDQIVYPALALLAAALIALALVWPQGQGAPSPAPFGQPLHPVDQGVAHAVAAVLRGRQPPAAVAPPAKREPDRAKRP
jgi:hypothetical protein